MTEHKPPIVATLTWMGDLRFAGQTGEASIQLDSASKSGPSPMEAVAFGLAGCMAIDLVHILARGRHPLASLSTHLVAHRAPTEPRRFERIALHFAIEGDATADQVERAIALSRDKYCSVWHSLRNDIELDVTYEIKPAK
jgi:putative redox protein